jgi:hypothetical protein
MAHGRSDYQALSFSALRMSALFEGAQLEDHARDLVARELGKDRAERAPRWCRPLNLLRVMPAKGGGIDGRST